jgi:hypothetical protein
VDIQCSNQTWARGGAFEDFKPLPPRDQKPPAAVGWEVFIFRHVVAKNVFETPLSPNFFSILPDVQKNPASAQTVPMSGSN